MTLTGVLELKNNLSRYARQIKAGKRVAVTVHGRMVTELVPPGVGAVGSSRYDELVAAGVIVPAAEHGGEPPEWPEIRLSRGSVSELIDSDRSEP